MQKLLIGMLAGATLTAGSIAQPSSITTSTISTDEDRWNYPFNPTPGVRAAPSTFGALFIPGFDDYDAQVVIGFDTTNAAAAGLAPACYRVTGVTVRAVIADSQGMLYDPTYDTFGQYLDPADPEFVTPDDGEPFELYGVGYRGFFPPPGPGGPVPVNSQTWMEDSIFGTAPLVPPAFEQRFLFATGLDQNGDLINVSNRFRNRFDATPFGIGEISGLGAGSVVPNDSEVAFSVDLSTRELLRYVQEQLAEGRVRFTIAGAHPAAGGPGGGGGGAGVFPLWYARENPLAIALGIEAKLDITLEIRNPADLNDAASPNPGSPNFGVPDGQTTPTDFSAFSFFFSTGDLRADLNDASAPNTAAPNFGLPDGLLTPTDFAAFAFFFQSGC